MITFFPCAIALLLVWVVSAVVESVHIRPIIQDALPVEWAFERNYAYILRARGGSNLTFDASVATIDASSETNTNSAEQTTIATNEASSPISKGDIVRSDKSKGIFSLYQVGDGSEDDPDGILDRYLRMQLGHRDDAMQAIQATLAWRKEHDIDHLLLRPQPKFDVCKAVFPHCFIGRDKFNHVILLQRPALIDIPKAKANSLTNDELLMHYVFVNEYLWQIVESEQALGTMTSVLDLRGLNFGVLKKTDLIGFCKTFISTMDAHYPQRAYKTLIINAPKWFNALYKLFSPLLRESTKAKIQIYPRGKKQDAALMELLDNAKDVFPSSVWSSHKESKKRKRHKRGDDGDDEEVDASSDNAWKCDSGMEKDLRAYVLSRLEVAGEKMGDVK
ncbi:hypothetical protein MPSEU_000996000 [Mayamaea pseudoterrestris]|nr:hypothetical protein MPSEU_000996000 [Mayamaea pseudoterrestris]